MTSESVLKRIREERIKQGISLRALGEQLGVSGQYLSMMERGITPLKMDDYLKICQILKVSPATILAREGDIKKREILAGKICALSERDFSIIRNIIQLMQ